MVPHRKTHDHALRRGAGSFFIPRQDPIPCSEIQKTVSPRFTPHPLTIQDPPNNKFRCKSNTAATVAPPCHRRPLLSSTRRGRRQALFASAPHPPVVQRRRCLRDCQLASPASLTPSAAGSFAGRPRVSPRVSPRRPRGRECAVTPARSGDGNGHGSARQRRPESPDFGSADAIVTDPTLSISDLIRLDLTCTIHIGSDPIRSDIIDV